MRQSETNNMENINIFPDDESCLYSVSIRYINDFDSSNFSVLIAKYHGFDPPQGYTDKDIFFYGMDEIAIKQAIENQELCEGEWIIMSLDGAISWNGMYVSYQSFDNESKYHRKTSKEISNSAESQVPMHDLVSMETAGWTDMSHESHPGTIWEKLASDNARIAIQQYPNGLWSATLYDSPDFPCNIIDFVSNIKTREIAINEAEDLAYENGFWDPKNFNKVSLEIESIDSKNASAEIATDQIHYTSRIQGERRILE